jgi:hypothetical protein
MNNWSNEWLNKCVEVFLENRLKRGLPSDTFKICVKREYFENKESILNPPKDSNLNLNNINNGRE